MHTFLFLIFNFYFILFNHWFPKLELNLFPIPIGVCSSACQKAAVCAAVGKLGSSTAGHCTALHGTDSPCPEELPFQLSDWG